MPVFIPVRLPDWDMRGISGQKHTAHTIFRYLAFVDVKRREPYRFEAVIPPGARSSRIACTSASVGSWEQRRRNFTSAITR